MQVGPAGVAGHVAVNISHAQRFAAPQVPTAVRAPVSQQCGPSNHEIDYMIQQHESSLQADGYWEEEPQPPLSPPRSGGFQGCQVQVNVSGTQRNAYDYSHGQRAGASISGVTPPAYVQAQPQVGNISQQIPTPGRAGNSTPTVFRMPTPQREITSAGAVATPRRVDAVSPPLMEYFHCSQLTQPEATETAQDNRQMQCVTEQPNKPSGSTWKTSPTAAGCQGSVPVMPHHFEVMGPPAPKKKEWRSQPYPTPGSAGTFPHAPLGQRGTAAAPAEPNRNGRRRCVQRCTLGTFQNFFNVYGPKVEDAWKESKRVYGVWYSYGEVKRYIQLLLRDPKPHAQKKILNAETRFQIDRHTSTLRQVFGSFPILVDNILELAVMAAYPWAGGHSIQMVMDPLTHAQQRALNALAEARGLIFEFAPDNRIRKCYWMLYIPHTRESIDDLKG